MPAHDLSLIIDAIEQAGDIARTFTGPTAKRWEKSDGAGPVTEADLAVDAELKRILCGARPDYGWLSEETEDAKDRLEAENVFVVDPIDGTRSFVEGARTWAISVAVARKGQVTAAAVYLPMRDMLYSASLGGGATLNGEALNVSQEPNIETSRILAARPVTQRDLWVEECPQFDRHYRPSLAYRLSLVAQGRFDGMLTLRPTWEWDIAAGTLIVSEAGGHATDRNGAPLVFNTPKSQLNGIVAAGGPIHGSLVTALRPTHHA
ncbi:MAG: 3'(2'),5'-bisphosphate nucleotidase CysQ [Rhodobacteraceae bacterium]|nr:3'(2'),5'-bisphosphate nucleotidase CysQ [Paracoccaceae bacterium]